MDMDKLKVPIDCPFVYVGEMSGDIIFCFEIKGKNCNICTLMQDACPAVLQMGCLLAAGFWRKAYNEAACKTERADPFGPESPDEKEAHEQADLWQQAAFSGDEP